MRKLILLLVIITPIILTGQLIDYQNLFFYKYAISPYADIKESGIGNYGFSKFDLYNSTPKRYYIKASSLFEINNSRFEKNNEHYKSETKTFQNEFNLVPELSFGFWINGYLLDFNYMYSKYNNPNSKSGMYSVSYEDNIYSGELKNQIYNKILQFSLNKKINNRLFFSIGVVTNHYLYEFEINNAKYNLNYSFFKKYQLLSSFIYSEHKTNLYLKFKSQLTNLNLSPNVYEGLHIDGNSYLPNNSLISYPGEVDAGIRFNLNNNVHISIESLNSYIFSEKTILIKDSTGSETGYKNKHSIWNSELSFGLDYHFENNFLLGVIFSSYIKYDNDVQVLNDSFPIDEYKIKYPKNLIFSGEYKIKNISFCIDYLFSYSKTIFETQYEKGYHKNFTNNLKVGLSIEY